MEAATEEIWELSQMNFSNKGAKVSGYTLQLFHKKGFTPDYIDHLEVAEEFSKKAANDR